MLWTTNQKKRYPICPSFMEKIISIPRPSKDTKSSEIQYDRIGC